MLFLLQTPLAFHLTGLWALSKGKRRSGVLTEKTIKQKSGKAKAGMRAAGTWLNE